MDTPNTRKTGKTQIPAIQVENEVAQRFIDSSRPALARTAAILCGNPEFQRFLSLRYAAAWRRQSPLPAHDRAANVIRETCGIQSRKELDSDTKAKQRYHQLIGLPFSTWRNHRENATP